MTHGYVAGSFDLLNVRDLDIIASAGARCDHLIVGVLTDDYVEAWQERPAVVSFAERASLVSHVRGVGEVRAHGWVTLPLLPDGCRIFAVDDEAPGYELGVAPTVLHPTRETGSRMVRDALRRPGRSVAA